MAHMTSNASSGTAALGLVARVAADLPSLTRSDLDELADAVEALTDAIGLQRDWPADAPADIDRSRGDEPPGAGDERAPLLPRAEPISAKRFHDEPGTDGWHVLYGGAQTVYPTGSFAAGVEFVRRIALATQAVGREPDIDLRPEAVVVRTAATPGGRLDTADAELVRRVSSIAAELGLVPAPDRLSTIQVAIAEAEGVSTREFWAAALGYESVGGFIMDPLRRGPRMWFDEIRTPGRGRTHIDVAVPDGRADERVTAALEAGGRLADESHAPAWWTLASPDNHGVDIAAWGDADDGA